MTPAKIEKELDRLIEMHGDIEAAAEQYQEACGELAEKISEYVGDRTEKWLEGEKGVAYQALVSELESIDFDIGEVTGLDLDY